jgi:hypothetical protein
VKDAANNKEKDHPHLPVSPGKLQVCKYTAGIGGIETISLPILQIRKSMAIVRA